LKPYGRGAPRNVGDGGGSLFNTTREEAAMAKVLVIDDEGDLRRILNRALTSAGHEVIEAADGREGVRLFRAHAPGIVVTDIVMPEQEGIQTITEIRSAGLGTGIIAMSGGGIGDASLYLNLANKLGADAVLSKPFRADELLAAVETLLGDRERGPSQDAAAAG
jgi:DNA-binding response OmpR family regulator